MMESRFDLHLRIAGRVRELRTRRDMSLDTLAQASGVSRAMISLIERGESNPTAVVLEKLAGGLGVALSSLFDAPAVGSSGPIEAVARRDDQPRWEDPASGYTRRSVSPPGDAQPIRIVEVNFPSGAVVAFEASVREVRVYQQVWVLEGTIDITLGTDRHRLREGDCLAMNLDRPTTFHNPKKKGARYVVVTAPGTRPRG